MFANELQFFIKNQDELVRQYAGQTLAIKDDQILGAYETPLDAYLETQKEHELGTFMIQPCEPGVEAFTVTISTLHVAV